MAQVLSQDEVDALLNAVNDGGSDDILGDSGGFDMAEEDENIQTYDLTNQDRVIREECLFWKSSTRGLSVNFEYHYQTH